MKKYLLGAIATLMLMSCTDANFSKMTNLGNGASIKCYSGGVLIYSGRSTGKISSEKNSDGYFFKEEGSGKLKEVSGNCDITYD